MPPFGKGGWGDFKKLKNKLCIIRGIQRNGCHLIKNMADRDIESLTRRIFEIVKRGWVIKNPPLNFQGLMMASPRESMFIMVVKDMFRLKPPLQNWFHRSEDKGGTAQ